MQKSLLEGYRKTHHIISKVCHFVTFYTTSKLKEGLLTVHFRSAMTSNERLFASRYINTLDDPDLFPFSACSDGIELSTIRKNNMELPFSI